MSDTFTFDTKDGKFTFTVMSEFLSVCDGNPSEFEIFDLMVTLKLNQFLHNPNGPAIIRNKDSYKEYWIKGSLLNEDQTREITNRLDFNNRLEEIVNE